MRSRTQSTALRPFSSAWYTLDVTGISTPSRALRSLRAYAVGMPSTTWPTSFWSSDGAFPCAQQFAGHAVAAVARRAGGDHVADAGQTGEGLEARPEQGDPSRMTSARLRVIRLARVLSPKPSPSAMPTAMATGFLAAPQNSTPATSSLR